MVVIQKVFSILKVLYDPCVGNIELYKRKQKKFQEDGKIIAVYPLGQGYKYFCFLNGVGLQL